MTLTSRDDGVARLNTCRTLLRVAEADAHELESAASRLRSQVLAQTNRLYLLQEALAEVERQLDGHRGGA